MRFEQWTPARRLWRSCSLGLALALGSTATFAQAATSALSARQVTIVVPFAPGGGTDIVARVLAIDLAKRLNTAVVVDNKPGAGGQIGNAFVARSKPDGHTLLLGITTLIQAPSLYKNLPYDAFKDFTPLAQLATSTNYLVVPAASPANTLAEFLALARSRPGQLNYGSNGNAGSSHLHGALLNASSKLGMAHIPYPGSGPLLTALLGQQVDAAFVDIAPLRPHLVSGKLKVLAGTGNKRTATLPDVPTMAEAGLPGFEPVGWFALFGPAGLPEPIRKLLSDAAVDALHQPDMAKRLQELGLSPAQLTPDAFAKSMRDDLPKWEKMIQTGNVSVE